MPSIALIPFSTKIAEELAGHVARGLSLELSEWLGRQGAEPMVLTSAQTEEDGAWRKLISFSEELTPENVSEFIHGIHPEAHADSMEEPEFALVISGMLEQIGDTNYSERCTSH